MPIPGFYHRADGETDFGYFNGADFISDSRSLNDRRGGTRSISASTEPSDSYAFNKITGQVHNLQPTNGDNFSPDINISASDQNSTVDSMDNITTTGDDQNFSQYKRYLDYLLEQWKTFNDLSAARTKDAREYSEYVYKNQAKWYVDGLKKAGINPLMIAHGLSPTPFTNMSAAQVMVPDSPGTAYANTANTQINSLVSLLKHAETLEFNERVAYLQHQLGLSQIEAMRYATNIGALTDVFGSAVSALSKVFSSGAALAAFL